MGSKTTGRGQRGSDRSAARRGVLALAGVVAVVLVIGAAWFVFAGARPPSNPGSPGESASATAMATRDPLEPLTIASVQKYPHLVFQNVIRDDAYAHVALIPLDAPGGMRVDTDLECERVSFAGGTGICLAAEHGADTRYYASLFGMDFRPYQRINLDGPPTYASVSIDGRLAAATVLLEPKSEENEQPPSRTIIVNTETGQPVADLDSFSVVRDGVPVSHEALDLWGVTFKSDGDGFFASLRLGADIYLVEGSLLDAKLIVRQQAVSAPSLSPDGTRIAYDRLVSSDGPTWRFHVLDLATGMDAELAERQSVDDQMAWLDTDRVLYGLTSDTWSLNSDGTGEPQPFLFDGLSASVVRH